MRTYFLVLLMLVLGCSESEGPEARSRVTVTTTIRQSPSAPPKNGQTLSGSVLLDGAVNGCGGEDIVVQVRDSGANYGTAVFESGLEGADCIFPFEIRVPQAKCYELLIERQPVGRYPASALGEDGYVGIISSESVYGDPESTAPARLYADFNGC